MPTKKSTYQGRVDELCHELGITEPQYEPKTTISELEEIIDKLEAQLPDDNSESGDIAGDSKVQGNKDETLSGDDLQESSDEEELTDDGELEMRAVKTFVARVNGRDTMLAPGDTCRLPGGDAMHAVSAGVAVLSSSRK